jgi:hypothetical protein
MNKRNYLIFGKKRHGAIFFRFIKHLYANFVVDKSCKLIEQSD